MVTRDQLDGSGDLLGRGSGVAGTFRTPRARTLAARYVYVFDTVICTILCRSSYVYLRTPHPVSPELLDSAAHDNARCDLPAPSARVGWCSHGGNHYASSRGRIYRATRSVLCRYSIVPSTSSYTSAGTK